MKPGDGSVKSEGFHCTISNIPLHFANICGQKSSVPLGSKTQKLKISEAVKN